MISIRPEEPGDAGAIRKINDEVFGQPDEGQLVDNLRKNGHVVCSLVALVDEKPVGHVLFSPATIGDVKGAGLAPVAVLPDYQNQGIGSDLIEAGLMECSEDGVPFVIVLGDPAFYPRFGFEDAAEMGITSQYPDAPEGAFRIAILDKNAMVAVTGQAKYSEEFSRLS